jgi:uncharacterized protein (DUF2147 family)
MPFMRMPFACLQLAVLGGALVSSTGLAAQDHSFGVWRNPSNSVHVRAEPCGERMCGVVVWANDKAKADARRGGTDPLVGSRLFRDFVQERPGVWRGKVFVPDIGKTFSGTVSIVDDDTIIGRGCLLLGRVGCRSQQWTRIAQ